MTEELSFEVSNKSADYGPKPLIRKGYYPVALVAVKEWTDKDGKLVDRKHGGQLILEMAVFMPDEKGCPTKLMTFDSQGEGAKKTVDVILPKFLYHKYFAKDENKNVIPGKYTTGFTRNSEVTHTFEAFGWKFDAEKPIKPLDYLGCWAEANINDYTKQEKGQPDVTWSTIEQKGIKPYTGPEVSEKVKETVKNLLASGGEQKEKTLDKPKKTKAQLQETLDRLTKMKENGDITQTGFDQMADPIKKDLEAFA